MLKNGIICEVGGIVHKVFEIFLKFFCKHILLTSA